MKYDAGVVFCARLLAALSAPLTGLVPLSAVAQTTYTENFTGAATNNSWYFINGACLTAGATAPASTVSPGQVPACVTNGVILPYYTAKGDRSLVGGNTGTLPDSATTGGALRFTNGAPYGFNENGAILSAFTFPTTNGVQITFTTETYEGNSDGSGKDGADGMSFFLQDVDQGEVADVGDYGGSLGYSCSNQNNDGTLRASGQPRGYDGLIGGFIGLGIDEYGNFLNASDNTSSGQAAASGYVGSGDYQPNRIGLRGAGSTAWSYLNATYPSYYPTTLTYPQRASALQQACTNGHVYDWSAIGTWNTTGKVNGVATPTQPTPTVTTTQLTNYAAIPNAFKVLGSTVKIANESALYRGAGTAITSGSSYGVPISYSLTITPAGLLSMSYSYNGGVYQPVIAGQDITQANGPLPNNVRFGFAGSTGGGTNVHEIMCFQAAPQSESGTSAGINQKQSAKVLTGTQVYFAYYNTNNWPGSLTSQSIEVDPADPTSLIYAPVANWDASCVLTGIAAGATCAATGVVGPVAPQASTARTILTWNGTTGVGFEWSSLTSAQQALLDPAGTPAAPNELNYLRGVRSNEINSVGVGLYRARTSVLGDIIDSSPTFVGPPSQSYAAHWTDLFDAGTAPTPPENAGGAEPYPAFVSDEQTRTNVVYTGADDGLLHGFRSGSYSSATAYDPADNDGVEVLAYMPGYIVDAINSSTNASNDYSNVQYAHHFDVDATPATGDLFYGNQWHTWIVGGLGPGGNAIYALDITHPGVAGAGNFSESAASTTVIGEWSTQSTTVNGVTTTTPTFSCLGSTANASTSASACGNNLGKTYGTPQIRRFHNGSWGFVFGNGYNSSTGDAGIYVGLVNSTTGAVTMYYLSTGQSGTANGIYYPSSLDIDGDNIVDFIYAGDLLGNVWRFDVTSTSPSLWTAGTTALYSPSGGAVQPITTKPLAFLLTTGVLTRVMVEFGTGEEIPQTNTAAAIYSSTQQALYGVWDWNMAAWNAQSAFPVETSSTPGPAPLTVANLEAQTIEVSYNAALTGSGSAFRTVSSNAVCYADLSGCSQYGWYLNLSAGPASSAAGAPTVYEQLLYTPALLKGVFIVNSTIPPTSTPTTCSSTALSSWTIAIDPATGGALSDAFFQYSNGNFINVTTTTAGETSTQGVSSVSDLGIGTPTSVTYNGQMFVISSPLPPGATPPPAGMLPSGSAAPFKGHGKPPSVKRWSWVERR
jgi:type IV pilus assembly protein PilY1